MAKQTFGSQGITREDRQARWQYNAGMFAILDAPCLILFCLDEALSLEYTMLDIGMLLQTVCLLAYERGLGTCILGVSVRYPDGDASINNFQRERAELAEFVFWSK